MVDSCSSISMRSDGIIPASQCIYSSTKQRQFLMETVGLIDSFIFEENKALKSNTRSRKNLGCMDGHKIVDLYNAYSSDVWYDEGCYFVDFTRRQLVVDEFQNWRLNILPIVFEELFFKPPKSSSTSKSSSKASNSDKLLQNNYNLEEVPDIDSLYFYDKSGEGVAERIRINLIKLGVLAEDERLFCGLTTDCDKSSQLFKDIFRDSEPSGMEEFSGAMRFFANISEN